jgi:ABC-type nickel/cobalt efflux system permease component RcnA
MEYESQREKSRRIMRLTSATIQGFAGILIISMGIVFLDKSNMGLVKVQHFLKDLDPFLIKMFGALCILYGAWRIYRAYNNYKNYE